MQKNLLISALCLFVSTASLFAQREPCDVGWEYVPNTAHVWVAKPGWGVYIVTTDGSFVRWHGDDTDDFWDIDCQAGPCKDILEAISAGRKPKRPPNAVDNPGLPIYGKDRPMPRLMKDVAEGKYDHIMQEGSREERCAKSKAAARSIIKTLKR